LSPDPWVHCRPALFNIDLAVSLRRRVAGVHAANVVANLSALSGDAHVTSIAFTDTERPR